MCQKHSSCYSSIKFSVKALKLVWKFQYYLDKMQLHPFLSILQEHSVKEGMDSIFQYVSVCEVVPIYIYVYICRFREVFRYIAVSEKHEKILFWFYRYIAFLKWITGYSYLKIIFSPFLKYVKLLMTFTILGIKELKNSWVQEFWICMLKWYSYRHAKKFM